MSEIKKYEVYHATDISNVTKIINGRFIYNANDQHWLGNGFYFFLDKMLVKNWAYKKIGGYGKIDTPAYIKCLVEVDEEHLLDLRFLEDYDFVKRCFDEFVGSLIGKYDIKNANYSKLRTLFFNYVIKKYDIHCIVAFLNERNSLTTKNKHENEFRNIKVPYIEVQMCLNRNEYIVDKEVVSI